MAARLPGRRDDWCRWGARRSGSTIAAWVDAGFSKFVLRPAVAPADWRAELEQLAEDVLDLQT